VHYQQKEDEIDAFVENVVADHSAFLNEAGYSGIANHKPPIAAMAATRQKQRLTTILLPSLKSRMTKQQRVSNDFDKNIIH
jgi:hypothetical protein